VLKKLESGEVGPARANAATNVLRTVLSTISGHETEARIASLELALERAVSAARQDA
jgi:hypothetical protein